MLNAIDKKLLLVLSESNGKLQAFTLYGRSEVATGLFSKSLGRIQKMGFVAIDGVDVSITNEGLSVISSSQRSEDLTKSWRVVPDRFLVPVIPINLPYIPSKKRLDRSRFTI